MSYLILAVNTAFLAINVFLLYMVKCSLKEMCTILGYIAGSDVPTPSEEDEIQKEVEKRDKEFAERIERLKEELSMNTLYIHNPDLNPAEELHPFVHNLPHDAVHEEKEPAIEFSI